MSFTVNLQQRIQQLKKIKADIPKVLSDVAEGATLRAIEKAQDATPPKMNSLRGTNTRTGELKAHWATDSKTKPVIRGNTVVTELNNNMEYASFVNDGHRMDRHFVPGLYVDNGILNYDPAAKVGLVVGTKTRYVKGEFMVDKAKAEFERVSLAELDKEIARLMK